MGIYRAFKDTSTAVSFISYCSCYWLLNNNNFSAKFFFFYSGGPHSVVVAEWLLSQSVLCRMGFALMLGKFVCLLHVCEGGDSLTYTHHILYILGALSSLVNLNSQGCLKYCSGGDGCKVGCSICMQCMINQRWIQMIWFCFFIWNSDNWYLNINSAKLETALLLLHTALPTHLLTWY